VRPQLRLASAGSIWSVRSAHGCPYRTPPLEQPRPLEASPRIDTKRHDGRSHVRRAALHTLRVLFENLDFIYLPSRDVAGDLKHFTDSLGARLVFAIEAFETRVAMLNLTEASPALLLAGHLEGDRPVLVYRVPDLEQTIGELARRGAQTGGRFEIPHGPGVELVMLGPQRVALYQLTRSETPARLTGRRDF
jgi:hypothetical protein